MKSTQHGFGTVAVAIHWLSAILILVLIGSGFRSGATLDPTTKATILSIHMPVAILILVLTLTRLVWWWRFDNKPPALGAVPAWQDTIARWTHRSLYALILVMLVSGIAMSVLSGLPNALFGTAPMPNLADLPPKTAHGIAGRLLVALIAMHACAALYHHFWVKDATLKRMWFGNK